MVQTMYLLYYELLWRTMQVSQTGTVPRPGTVIVLQRSKSCCVQGVQGSEAWWLIPEFKDELLPEFGIAHHLDLLQDHRDVLVKHGKLEASLQ